MPRLRFADLFVTHILQKWRTLKEQGVNESNPEFAQLANYLKMVQARQQMHQQQMHHQAGAPNDVQHGRLSQGVPQANGMCL